MNSYGLSDPAHRAIGREMCPIRSRMVRCDYMYLTSRNRPTEYHSMITQVLDSTEFSLKFCLFMVGSVVGLKPRKLITTGAFRFFGKHKGSKIRIKKG